MNLVNISSFCLKLGQRICFICYWIVSAISMNRFINVGIQDAKVPLHGGGGKMWQKCGEKISRIHQSYHQFFGSLKIAKIWWKKLLMIWIFSWILAAVLIFWFMNSQATEKRKETLANMCDERASMLQDQFNVSMNHIQAISILISIFHHGKSPTAIDQRTFASYTEDTAFERPLTSGVAYAVRVLHTEREQFEKQQGWTIRRMDTLEQNPVHEDEYSAENLEPSPVQDEYAPVIFAQDTIKHVVSLDVLSGKEDRDNVLRARESGKGVLTAPFRLVKSNRLGVILTFAIYKKRLPPNATPNERVYATSGYLGGVFEVETLVEKLLHQLASKQTILVNVFDTTNQSEPISMYGSNDFEDDLEHVSYLNFGDPVRKHEMRCRFKKKPPWPWLAIMTSIGVLVIALLIGQIFYATVNRIAKVEDDCHKMMELKKRAEAADVAKSQFLATVSHEIRTPMNGVLGMMNMIMDTELDETQQDYVRTAQASGKALVSLINEVLDQAKIESGKLDLVEVQFDLRAIMDDVLSLFSGKSHEKGVELAVYISHQVPVMLIGDPGRFRQIITNLMGNSIKFTQKGHIFVTVHLVEEVMDVETEESSLSGLAVADRRHSWKGFRAFSQDNSTPPIPSTFGSVNIIVSVEDTGDGIPLEAQPRIFTPFVQVGPSMSRYGGTGIGLSISKCLVGLMRGDIGFASTPKIGSTFTFSAVFTKSPQVNNQSTHVSTDFQGMRALVVDPRSVRAKVSRYHIQRLGIDVEVVSDFSQVLSRIVKATAIPDMVLIEQDVWDKDFGASTLFAENMQKIGRGVPPKLFLLGNPIRSTRTAPTASCGPSFILKPLRASMLAASLQRIMFPGNKGAPRNGEGPNLSLRNLLLGRKILIVDDNDVNRRVAAGALKKYGADVVTAESGAKAISLLNPPHEFDACFMDVQMPEMDGFEATSKIRDIEQNISGCIERGESSVEAYGNVSSWHVPILAMTADVIHATHDECLKCGMDGYVSKPFEADQLYREVSRFFQTDSAMETA